MHPIDLGLELAPIQTHVVENVSDRGMGRLGITAIIIEGQAGDDELFILKIDGQGTASLIPANDYKGMRTYPLTQTLLKTYGEKTSVLVIGPAGEYQLTSASIQASDVDGRPCRAAARGGLGAVMGAKGIKAIVIDQEGKDADAIADPKAFKEAAKKQVVGAAV